MVVGDIVKGLPGSPYGITNQNMTRGLVVDVDGNNIKVKILEHTGGCAGTFCVNAKHFEVIGHVKPFDRESVIAILQSAEKGSVCEYDLRRADLRRANLSDADLSDADLSDANLSNADLSGANLRRADGLMSSIAYIDAHFERVEKGFIAYKTFGGRYAPPSKWTIAPESIIEENVNPCRTDDCGCGINVAPLEWVKKNYRGDIWKCLIEWAWLPGVVVPYGTDGKIRCERVRLLEKV